MEIADVEDGEKSERSMVVARSFHACIQCIRPLFCLAIRSRHVNQQSGKDRKRESNRRRQSGYIQIFVQIPLQGDTDLLLEKGIRQKEIRRDTPGTKRSYRCASVAVFTATTDLRLPFCACMQDAFVWVPDLQEFLLLPELRDFLLNFSPLLLGRHATPQPGDRQRSQTVSPSDDPADLS